MSGTLGYAEPLDAPGRLETIGAVLRDLQREFPDLTISKIRFLESEGLVDPVRTPSGYRKFSEHDIERLRYVLRAQRDHFLPLRVIAEHLDAMDRGLEPPQVTDSRPRVPVNEDSSAGAAPGSADGGRSVRVSRQELARESGLDLAQVIAAQDAGFIRPLPDGAHYGPDSVEIARVLAELAQAGLDMRHLGANRRAATSQFERVEAVANAARPGKSAPVQDAVRIQIERLTLLQARLHALLLRSQLLDLLSV